MTHTLLALKRVFEKSFCILLICTVGIPTLLHGQGPITLTNGASFKIKQYGVLPDAKYSLDRILKDSSLVFKKGLLNAAISDGYWIKVVIQNPYPNDEHYFISVADPLNYTLYWYSAARKKWLYERAGINAAQRIQHLGTIPIVLRAQSRNVLYVKVDLADVKSYTYAKRPAFILQKGVTFEAEQRFFGLFFLVCCTALISFACYNLYIYFQLRDKAYLYYVIVQVGSLIFFTGDNLYFNILFPLRIYNLIVLANGDVKYHDINFFAEHVGVAILFWGFSQFTRSYLSTEKLLPKWDKTLKILGFIFFWVEIIPALITLSGLYYCQTVVIDNVFIIVIIATCLTTGLVAQVHKVSVAKHYLAANLLPAFFAFGASLSNLIYGVNSPIMPTLAILSQIFTFAVALVARVKLMNADLNARMEETMQLKIKMTTEAYERLLVEQKNQHMMETMALEQEKNELLLQKLEANQRELVGNSLHMHQKNKLLSDLKTQVQNIDSSNPLDQPEILKNIKASLKHSQYLDENWSDFKMHFEQVHPSFFNNLMTDYPTLTTYELRLYAYFHINLSTKEIAALLNIAPASVRQAKTRLYKKIKAV